MITILILATVISTMSIDLPDASTVLTMGPSHTSIVDVAMDNHLDKVELKVDGIGCPYCSAGFIKAMKKLGKVQDVNTSFEEGTFSFSIPKEDKVSLDALKKTTSDAGYTLTYAMITREIGRTHV